MTNIKEHALCEDIPTPRDCNNNLTFGVPLEELCGRVSASIIPASNVKTCQVLGNAGYDECYLLFRVVFDNPSNDKMEYKLILFNNDRVAKGRLILSKPLLNLGITNPMDVVDVLNSIYPFIWFRLV